MGKGATIGALVRDLRAFWRAGARSHLPWRATQDPYRVLVSEIMLQQTQVERVVPYYSAFIKKYPTASALAGTPLSEVLSAWQGLGYNRRARYLWASAKIITKDGWGGRLPGVGPYTKAAVQAFAYNKPTVFIETNIRTVFFHHLGVKRTMSDKELLPMIEEALRQSKMQPRDFYSALMDYGAHLKRQGIKLNKLSRHYAKQSKFEGSARQKRARKLRRLLAKGAGEKELEKVLNS